MLYFSLIGNIRLKGFLKISSFSTSTIPIQSNPRTAYQLRVRVRGNIESTKITKNKKDLEKKVKKKL